jgi:hypothetical protein
MIEVWMVDQRWLILPRCTQPSPDSEAAHREVEITVAESAATAPGRAKTDL